MIKKVYIFSLLFSSFLLSLHLYADETKSYKRAWPMMGGILKIEIWETNAEKRTQGFAAAFKAIEEVDQKISTYKEQSEISKLNRAAGNRKWISLHPLTLEILRISKEFYALSEGRLDITIGPLVQLWGFRGAPKGDFLEPPEEKWINKIKERVGPSVLEVDSKNKRARLKKRGSFLDLGSIAKGYALDQAKTKLLDSGIKKAILQLGEQVLVMGLKNKRIEVRDPKDLSQAAYSFNS